ncbi:hypothetical protein D3C75_997350 [compost metagenome]
MHCCSVGHGPVDFTAPRSTICQGGGLMMCSDRTRSLYPNFHQDPPGEDHAQAYRCRFHEPGRCDASTWRAAGRYQRRISLRWLDRALQRRRLQPGRTGSVLAAVRVIAGAAHLRHLRGVLAAGTAQLKQHPYHCRPVQRRAQACGHASPRYAGLAQ